MKKTTTLSIKRFPLLFYALISLSGAVVGIYLDADKLYAIYSKNKNINESTNSYEKQLRTLNDVENNLNNLKLFVKNQKTKLNESASILQSLKDEQKKLTPIVQADKKVIESIFQFQEERNKSSKWIERGIGFLLGITGSLIATIIWSLVRGRQE